MQHTSLVVRSLLKEIKGVIHLRNKYIAHKEKAVAHHEDAYATSCMACCITHSVQFIAYEDMAH